MNKNIVIDCENIQYILWFSKDLKLCCNKKIDGKFVLGLDNKDKEIISSVINSLCVSKENSYFIRSAFFNDISYNLYYDYKKFLYFTDCFDDNVNSYINMKYNNMPLVYSSFSNEKNNISKVFNRSIKNGMIKFNVGASLFLMAFNLGTNLYYDTSVGDFISKYISGYEDDISGEISFNELNISNSNVETMNGFNISDLEKIGNVSINMSEQQRNITFDEMKDILDKNPNVDNEFKKFFSKLNFAFEDDLKYFDSSILNKLETLKVEYDSVGGNTVNGRYYPFDNKIVYYNVNSFNEVDPNTALHELGHVFQSVNTSNICFELSNEVWTREVLRLMVDRGLISGDLFKKDERGNIIYVDGYTDKLFLYYYLLELMPTESIKKFQWMPDDSILVSSIADMSNLDEVNMIHEVLDLIDECRNESFLRLSDEKVIQIRSKLEYFYNKNKGISMQNDLDVFAYDYAGIRVISPDFNNFLVQNSSISSDFNNYNLNDVVYYSKSKSYFSDAYQTELYCGLLQDGFDKRNYFSINVDDNMKYEFVEFNQKSMNR